MSELRMLRDLELIRNRIPISNLPQSFRLKDHFDLTSKGRQYLDWIATSK